MDIVSRNLRIQYTFSGDIADAHAQNIVKNE